MMLYSGLSAKYKLDARITNGQRLETDTVEAATYSITDLYGNPIVIKTLDNGLTIDHDDNAGDGFIFVTISNNEAVFAGKVKHSLVVTDCQGNNYGVKLRPEFIYFEG